MAPLRWRRTIIRLAEFLAARGGHWAPSRPSSGPPTFLQGIQNLYKINHNYTALWLFTITLAPLPCVIHVLLLSSTHVSTMVSYCAGRLTFTMLYSLWFNWVHSSMLVSHHFAIFIVHVYYYAPHNDFGSAAKRGPELGVVLTTDPLITSRI